MTDTTKDRHAGTGREIPQSIAGLAPGALHPATAWDAAVAAMRRPDGVVPPPWADVFAPLKRGAVDDLMVVAQLGQTLDGRIATSSGHSHYINGRDGLDHLHRLRALVDAVVVGIRTAVADDPQLTVRRVAGPNPVRVIIDPRGRLAASARALIADGTQRIVIRREGTVPRAVLPADVEIVELASGEDGMEPAAILSMLAARGLRRVLIEGGAGTVSRFLAANCLDRLHIVVAPLILGSGSSGLVLPPIDRVEQGLRPRTRVHMLGAEVLFDCDLSDQRATVAGRAKKSM